MGWLIDWMTWSLLFDRSIVYFDWLIDVQHSRRVNAGFALVFSFYIFISYIVHHYGRTRSLCNTSRPELGKFHVSFGLNFPDSVPYSNYVTIFDGNNTPNVVEIDKTISRDVCGKGVRKIAMRVRAIDKDGINDGKNIPNDFSVAVEARMRTFVVACFVVENISCTFPSFSKDKIDNYKCHITGDRNPPRQREERRMVRGDSLCGEDRPSSK